MPSSPHNKHCEELLSRLVQNGAIKRLSMAILNRLSEPLQSRHAEVATATNAYLSTLPSSTTLTPQQMIQNCQPSLNRLHCDIQFDVDQLTRSGQVHWVRQLLQAEISKLHDVPDNLAKGNQHLPETRQLHQEDKRSKARETRKQPGNYNSNNRNKSGLMDFLKSIMSTRPERVRRRNSLPPHYASTAQKLSTTALAAKKIGCMRENISEKNPRAMRKFAENAKSPADKAPSSKRKCDMSERNRGAKKSKTMHVYHAAPDTSSTHAKCPPSPPLTRGRSSAKPPPESCTQVSKLVLAKIRIRRPLPTPMVGKHLHRPSSTEPECSSNPSRAPQRLRRKLKKDSPLQHDRHRKTSKRK